MKLAVFIVLCLTIIPGMPAALAATHCGANERVIFSCAAGKKVISVCASQDLSPAAGTLHYRFGPAGKPETSYPPKDASRDVIRAGRWMFSGGGGAWLAFYNPPFRYLVYTATGRGWGEKSGVSVEKDGQIVKNFSCQGIVESSIGDELFISAGIKDDESPFELP